MSSESQKIFNRSGILKVQIKNGTWIPSWPKDRSQPILIGLVAN